MEISEGHARREREGKFGMPKEGIYSGLQVGVLKSL